MATVHKRACAKRDLVEQYMYLGEHADFETAERFLANADASFTDLSRNRGMGAPRSLRSPKLAGLHNGVLAGSDGELSCRTLAQVSYNRLCLLQDLVSDLFQPRHFQIVIGSLSVLPNPVPPHSDVAKRPTLPPILLPE